MQLIFLSSTMLFTKVRFSSGGLSIGLGLGYVPDVFNLSNSNEALANQNINILNRMNQVNNLYDSSSYGEKSVVRDFQYDSNEIAAIPAELSLKYSWYGVLFRIGMSYYSVPINTKSYVLTTGSATSRKITSSSGSNTFYEDLDQLYDGDSQNDEKLAVGLRPTYGQPVRFIQFLTARRIEIPVTFGVSMFDLGPASFYFGGGFTFFWGRKQRVITAKALDTSVDNSAFFQDDVDIFTTTNIGFNIMTGAEYRFTENVGLMIELTLSFASSNPIIDSVRTGAFTNNSLFHENDGRDYGGNEKTTDIAVEKGLGTSDARQMGKGFERTDTLDFTEIKIMFGLNYHIMRNN